MPARQRRRAQVRKEGRRYPLYWAVRLPIALCISVTIATPRPGMTADPAASVCASYRQDADDDSTAAADTQPLPFSHGLLWVVKRSGIADSYVFGTMHVDTPALTRLPDPVRKALATSERLVMETRLDAHAQAVYSTRAFLPDDETLKPLLPPSLVDTYLKISADYALPADTAMKLTPWAATNLIGRPASQSGPGMEDVLRDAAQRAGKPIVALETMEELLDTLAAMPTSDQVEILTDTICNHDRILKETDRLEQIYQRRDLAALLRFNDRGHHDQALFLRYRQRMLYDRSTRMVKRMLPYLQRGGTFVAVGALHLAGEHGILQGLEARGYEITAAY